jgi:formylglycine-generating enzyme required for sulfatase activity
LSDQEKIPKEQWCYEPNQKKKYAEGMKLKANYLQLKGYRLPSEAEWECACRATSVTSRYYGETEEMLERYAWYTKNSLDQCMLPTGSLKPNDLGLFDMLGNAQEWCQEQFSSYTPGDHCSDDKEDGTLEINSRSFRMVRGASFLFLGLNLRSAFRTSYPPDKRNPGLGFRPARTLGEPRPRR